MLDAAKEAIEFARGHIRADLDDNRMFVLALIKDIEIIGEAACQTSESTRNQVENIPWEDIIGTRHRLVHGYFDINLDVLWQTIQDDLPGLVQVLQQFLGEWENK
jgi:uncharacterized protein with HEPN domain